MRVVLARSQDLQKGLLGAVHEILVASPGPLEFDKANKPVALAGDPASPVDWEAIFGACRSARPKLGLEEKDFLVLLMGRRNTPNWFSSCDPEGARNIFIQAADWNAYVACPPEHPLAFQVGENLLQALMFETLEEGARFFHDPPIGCINDMCSWKPHITFKLRTADLCLECQRVIGDKGIPDDLVGQLLDVFEGQRRAMLFRASIPAIGGTLDFPFPIAITRRKMVGTTEPFRKFLMLLDHFDSLVRCTVITAGCTALKDGFADFFQEQGLNDRPSLGHWIEALRRLCGVRAASVPALPERLLERIRAVVRKADEAGIVSIRNEKRGHGYCDCTNEAYNDLFLEHLPTVADIESMLRPMYLRTRWCYTISMTQPRSGAFAFRVKDLSGDHPDFNESDYELQPRRVEDVPRTDTIYAVTYDDAWHSLAPYVLYRDCPACGHHRVLVSDGQKFIDPYVGHRVSIVGA